MKRTIVLIILIVSIIVEVQGFSFKKDKIRLVPVYEKTFQDTIVDVIFDTATVKIEEAKAIGWKKEAFGDEEKRIGEGEIFYTKVVILKDGNKRVLRFFDPKGRQRKSFETADYAEIVISQNDKYIGITTPGDHESKFQMVNTEGRVLWKIKGLGTGPYIPSQEGKYAVGEPSVEVENVPVEIYNKDGLIKKIRKDYAGFWANFSENDEFIAVGIPLEFPKGKLIVFDKEFKILYVDTTLGIAGDIGGGDYISFSPKNKYLVYPLKNGGVKIFNIFKKSISNLEILGKGNYKYYFDQNEKLLLIKDAKGFCWLLDLLSKRLLWQYLTEGKSFGTVSTDKDLNKILICIYPNKILLLNQKGVLTGEYKIKDIVFNIFPKKVKISSKTDKFTVIDNHNRIESFSLKK